MKAFGSYERLTGLLSETLMVRAILPWIFVILLDLGICGVFLPDGQSLANAFLPESHRAWALLGLAAWLVALTSLSDGLATFAIRHLRETAAGIPSSSEALPNEIKLWWTEAQRQPASTNLPAALGRKIDRALTATLRHANLAIGLAASIWAVTLALPTYQRNTMWGAAAVAALAVLMIGSLYRAHRGLNTLIALDGMQHGLAESNSQGLQNSGGSSASPGVNYAHSRWVRAAVLCLLFLVVVAPIAYLLIFSDPSRHRKANAEHLTILAVNDVYRLDGVEDGEKGGLARLRTLRKKIEAEGRDVILLHAGDFLSPSLIGSVFKGKQMIDIMNRLDGNEYAFDDKMFVIFGNHEFDDSKCGSLAAVLDDRVNQSQFAWLNSNLDFSSCGMLDSIAAQQKVKEDVLLNVGSIKIGLFGIGLTPEGAEGIAPKDYPKYQRNRAVAAKRIDSLRASGADFIIAVTHLYWGDDQKLLDEFGSKGLNLIIGGHDHECMTLTARDGSAYGFKADSDAKTAWRIDLDFPASGKPSITRQIFKLEDAIEPDPDLASRSAQWQSKAETEICKKMAKEEKMLNDPACLDKEIGSTQADLELEESDNRTRETAFGDWLADEVRKKAKADVALINSGTLGLDETVAAGSKLKLRRLKEIFRYDDNVATGSVPVATVCEALKHGFSTPGKGAWPHVSGVSVELQDAEGGKKSAKVLSFTDRPDINCASEGKIKVAALPYLLCDGDAYNFGILKDLPDTETCINRLSASGEGNGRLITIAKTAIALAGNAGIEPKIRGRISPPSAAQPTPRPPICEGGKSETSQYR